MPQVTYAGRVTKKQAQSMLGDGVKVTSARYKSKADHTVVTYQELKPEKSGSRQTDAVVHIADDMDVEPEEEL